MSLKYIKSEFEFNTKVLEEKQVFCVIYFYAQWCGPCKMFASTYEEVAKNQKEDVKLFKLDIDVVGDVPASYGIMSIPTFIGFKDGIEVAREIGVPSDFAFWINSNKS